MIPLFSALLATRLAAALVVGFLAPKPPPASTASDPEIEEYHSLLQRSVSVRFLWFPSCVLI